MQLGLEGYGNRLRALSPLLGRGFRLRPLRVARRPATVAPLFILLLALAAVAVMVLRPLDRQARAPEMPSVAAPAWTPSTALAVVRIPSPYHHIRQSAVDTLVIHVSEGSFASVVRWFQNNPDEVSAHYLVAQDGRIVQFVNERFAAHHAGRVSAPAETRWRRDGNPNEYSIGIELESPAPLRRAEDIPSAQREALWALAADLVARHHIPVDREHIVAHSEIDPLNRADPGPGFPWEELLRHLGRPVEQETTDKERGF